MRADRYNKQDEKTMSQSAILSDQNMQWFTKRVNLHVYQKSNRYGKINHKLSICKQMVANYVINFFMYERKKRLFHATKYNLGLSLAIGFILYYSFQNWLDS